MHLSVFKPKHFVKLVDEIIGAKKQKPTADTTKLEDQIDQLVYQLYNLTVEEIKVIENN